MHVITRKRLNTFARAHPAVASALKRWYHLAKDRNFASFEDLRSTFSGVDQVGKLIVFNIGGNKVRLVAAVHYNRRKIYIRAVLTHAEYDQSTWKE
ncbi:MAG: type II toxin-antitoxin system HigB family toxin [Thermoanaerobaculia bacterium]|nr:type II toxin-antitoxin system HigB family toxin [Thermoanaerobaculia bacterium]